MDDVATVHSENENLKRVRIRLLQWEAKKYPLAALSSEQDEYLDVLSNLWNEVTSPPSTAEVEEQLDESEEDVKSDVIKLPENGISTANDFMLWYDQVDDEIHQYDDATYRRYLFQLESRRNECSRMLDEIKNAINKLNTLTTEYDFVSQKTSDLNSASETLIEEQERLQQLSEEIQRRLYYFNQVELINQRLQSPTISVAGEVFKDCLNRIDECLLYLKENPKFKDAAAFTMKYKHCLAKAITLVKNYVGTIMTQATEAILNPKQNPSQISSENSLGSTPDAIFALYYGKYQTSAAKIKKVAQLIEPRSKDFSEYEQLLSELQHSYLQQRANIMSPAVDQAIKDIKITHKGDHCSLMRSACGFLVHICQDEQRLYYQFFTQESEQLTSYLEGLCNVLYDTMRPFIIHINHLETLAEICSILRIEILEEHVQQNPDALSAFAIVVNQLLQDVQERLVFRAHLYLSSDILNYNPSVGDLAYPDKLEMMESIALSLQEHSIIRRSDSRSSLISSVSSAMENESVDTAYRSRNSNSPADLHGMWYPTVRRTLVCLSRLYRCVDRPVFQGLSQEALELCIQSVASAAAKITAAKTPVDGELFEIKHLLILREQIAPFRVDFTVKETSLDFSKVKTAAFGLLQKRKQLFAMGSNNALLEFLLEGTPQIKEHLHDSRKEVDRQLKTSCELFIKDAVKSLVGPIISFMEKANTLLVNSQSKTENGKEPKVNYSLRQSPWASPQQISGVMQETQRLIKSKLPLLQRSMQLYLSNRDTEFIIFRPIRNNIIQHFVKLEQLLTTNGYSSDDLIIAGCPSAEQVSIMLSSASIAGPEGVVSFSGTTRKISTSSNEGGNPSVKSATPTSALKKFSFDKKVNNPDLCGNQNSETMANVPEVLEPEENPTSLTNENSSLVEKSSVNLEENSANTDLVPLLDTTKS